MACRNHGTHEFNFAKYEYSEDTINRAIAFYEFYDDGYAEYDPFDIRQYQTQPSTTWREAAQALARARQEETVLKICKYYKLAY